MDLDCDHPPPPEPNPDQTEVEETREPSFYFFSPANLDCLIRILNSDTFNNRFWIFAAALTNVNVIVSTATPPAAQAELSATSPVSSGDQVFVHGSGFPPGEARKVILDPSGQTVYDITINIGADGTLSADFYIPGPAGTWRVVVYTSSGNVETTFEVTN